MLVPSLVLVLNHSLWMPDVHVLLSLLTYSFKKLLQNPLENLKQIVPPVPVSVNEVTSFSYH